MSFTYDVATDRGKVRMLVGDTDSATAANQVWNDAEIDAFLSLNNSVIRLAAAQALEAMAASEAYVQKVMTIHGLSTNGEAVARSLRETAAGLRRQVQEGEDGDVTGLFDWAEMVTTDPAGRERVWAQYLRGAV